MQLSFFMLKISYPCGASSNFMRWCHERRIDITILNMFEQWLQVPMNVRLSHFERQTFVHGSTHRHLVYKA